jgi:hypothetical protein
VFGYCSQVGEEASFGPTGDVRIVEHVVADGSHSQLRR